MPSGFTRFSFALCVGLSQSHNGRCSPIPLSQAKQLLIEHNDTLATARLDLESVKIDHQKRLGSLLPSLTATAELSHANNFTNPSTTQSALGSVSMAATLFDGGQNWIELKKSKIAVARQELKFCSTLQQSMIKLRELYLKATLLTFEQQAHAQSRALLKKEFLVASQRFKEGIAVPQDFYRLSAEVERAELESQSDQQNQKNLTEDLARLLGLEPGSASPEALSFDDEILERRTAFARAKLSLAEQIATLSQSEASLVERQGLLKRLPTASLKGTLGPSTDRLLGYGTAGGSGADWSAGLSLSLSFVIWDFDQTSSDHKKAAVELARANIQAQAAAADSKLQAAQLARTLQYLQAQIASDQRLDELYQKTFQIVSRRYAQSSVTLLELLDTLTLWTNSRIRRLKGQSDWLAAADQYQSVYGELEPCKN